MSDAPASESKDVPGIDGTPVSDQGSLTYPFAKEANGGRPGDCEVMEMRPGVLWLRMPVMVAWSTPGAAVLATAGLAGGFSMAEAVGAFLVCGALIVLFGATGWFEKLMNRIPMAIASALLAGVLARFGLQAFAAAQTALPLVLLMLATYLVARRAAPRYAVVLTLVVAIAFVAARGEMAWSRVTYAPAMPVFTMPQFSIAALTSLALPLFVVTMASQNLPGVAAIRAAG